MTRIELERKCDEVGLDCFEIGNKCRTRGRTLWSHAKAESEHGVAEDTDRKSVGIGLKTGMESIYMLLMEERN